LPSIFKRFWHKYKRKTDKRLIFRAKCIKNSKEIRLIKELIGEDNA
jgi:hypothetical protein